MWIDLCGRTSSELMEVGGLKADREVWFWGVIWCNAIFHCQYYIPELINSFQSMDKDQILILLSSKIIQRNYSQKRSVATLWLLTKIHIMTFNGLQNHMKNSQNIILISFLNNFWSFCNCTLINNSHFSKWRWILPVFILLKEEKTFSNILLSRKGDEI